MMEIDTLVYSNNLLPAMLNSADQSSCGGRTCHMISGDISCNFFLISLQSCYFSVICAGNGGHTIITSAL
jgi:hypothetical protein